MTTNLRRKLLTFLVAAVAVPASLIAAPSCARAETVATVAGKPITLEELEKRVRPQLIEIENSRYEVLEAGLDELVAEPWLHRRDEVLCRVRGSDECDVDREDDDQQAQDDDGMGEKRQQWSVLDHQY